MGLVFALALAVRLLYVTLAAHADPFFAHTLRGFDQNVYRTQALGILDGDWLLRKDGIFYYSPLFSYFSALVWGVFGRENFLALHLVQALLGGLTSALSYVLAATWLSRRAALLAALCWALAAPWLFFEQALLHEGLMLFFYAVLLWGLRTAQMGRRAGGARLLLAGAAGALAMIGRGNALLLLLTLPLWILVALRCRTESPLAVRRWAWGRAGLFVLGVLLALAPLAARNRVVSGRWTLGMSNGRVLFYLGNAADASGQFAYSPRFQAALEKAAQDPGVYLRMFGEDVRSAPGAIAWNLLRKSYFFLAARDLPDNLNFQLGRRLVPLAGWSPVQWEWLMPLALVGLGLTFCRRQGDWSLLWLFAALFAASLIIIVPIGRYRQPILIPAVIWAALALEWVGAAWRLGRLRLVAAAAGAFVVLGLTLWPWSKPSPYIRSNDYTTQTRAALEQKQFALARKVLALGFTQYPGEMGLIELHVALAAAEHDTKTLRGLADLLWMQRRWGMTSGLRMADFYARDGQIDRARTILQSLAKAHPDRPELRLRLRALGQPASR